MSVIIGVDFAVPGNDKTVTTVFNPSGEIVMEKLGVSNADLKKELQAVYSQKVEMTKTASPESKEIYEKELVALRARMDEIDQQG